MTQTILVCILTCLILFSALPGLGANKNLTGNLKEAEESLLAGNLDKAESLYLECAKAGKLYALTGDAISDRLCEIARLHSIGGDRQRARQLFRKCLSIQRKTDKDFYESNAITLDQLAAIELKDGRESFARKADSEASKLYMKCVPYDLGSLSVPMARSVIWHLIDLEPSVVLSKRKFFETNLKERERSLPSVDVDVSQALIRAMLKIESSDLLIGLRKAQSIIDRSKKKDAFVDVHKAIDVLELMERKDYAKAEQILEALLDKFERIENRKEIDAIAILWCLENIYEKSGEKDKMERVSKRLHRIIETEVKNSPVNLQTSRRLFCFSVILDKNETSEAESLLRKLIVIQEKLFGRNDAALVNTLTLLAQNLDSQKRFEESTKAFEDALKVSKNVYGTESLGYTKVLNSLAVHYQLGKKYDEAFKCFQQVADTCSNLGSIGKTQYIEALSWSAMTLDWQDKCAEAAKLYEQVLAEKEKFYGVNSDKLLDTINMLSFEYTRQEQFERADVLLDRFLCISEQAAQSQNISNEVKSALQQYRMPYWQRTKEQEKYYQRLFSIYKKAFDNDPPMILVLHALGKSQLSQGKFAEAEESYQQAFTLIRKLQPTDSALLPESFVGLAKCFEGQSKLAQAGVYFKMVVSLLASVDLAKKTHARILLDVADFNLRMGNTKDSAIQFVQVLTEDPKFAKHISISANTLIGSAKFAEAAELLRQLLIASQTLPGISDADREQFRLLFELAQSRQVKPDLRNEVPR